MTGKPSSSPVIHAVGPIDTLRFMFAVGIECSYPKIAGGERVDQLQSTGHYELWKSDLKLVRELHLRYLRYGPPTYKIFRGKDDYDWGFTDEVMHEMRRLGIVPIIDLLHFGLPDWLGDFQNPSWPDYFAEFAHQFAVRYPWVRYYTPVNEIYVTAQFSASFGWWNEQIRSADSWYHEMREPGFVTNIKHCCKGSILAMKAVLDRRPDAIFVFSESTEHVHVSSPDPALVRRARFLNERRFIALDLLFGHDVSATIYRYLMNSGMTDAEYQWFMGQHDAPGTDPSIPVGSAVPLRLTDPLRSHCVLGTDYYITNEHLMNPDGTVRGYGRDAFGYHEITRLYHQRYGLPVMHTETNRAGKYAVDWLWTEWLRLLRLRDEYHVPILGFTWYGLVDMMDWDVALREKRGRVNTVGLYTLGRKPRKVAREYRRLVEEYSHLPISSTKMPMLTT